MMFDNIDNIINSGFLISSIALLVFSFFAPIYAIGLELYTTYEINKSIKDRANKLNDN